MAMPTLVVTGAGGFIGSRVVRRLLEAGAALSLLYGPGDAQCALASGARAFQGDLQDRALLPELVAGAHAVIHLAGPPSVRRSFDDPVGFARTHVAGTAAIVEACAKAAISRIVYVSSAEVYGSSANSPVAEDAPTCPVSPYAAAKLGAEAFVRAFAEQGVEAVVLRPFSVYGTGQSPDSVLARIVAQAWEESSIVLETLRPIRDFVHVDDVADAVVRACRAPLRTAFRVFNVGTGKGTSIGELAQLVTRAIGCELPVLEQAGQGTRKSDISELTADTSRIASELGWVPAIALPIGLARLLAESSPEGT